MPAPPPTASLGFAPAPSRQPRSQATPSSRTTAAARHAQEAAATNLAPSSKAVQQQPKDYGAPWAAAAAHNGPASLTPALAKSPAAGNLPTSDAPSLGKDQPMHDKGAASSPSLTGPKPHSSLTAALASQSPATSGFLLTSSFDAAPAGTAAMLPLPAFWAVPQAASPTSGLSGSQPSASQAAAEHQPSMSAWTGSRQQQQEATDGAQSDKSAATILANGPSNPGDSTAQQAVSTTSGDSGDTSVNLYPFPNERSAQDRLEGIVSSATYAEDVDSLYVFGRSEGMLADLNVPADTAAHVPASHENGDHVASPSMLCQVQHCSIEVICMTLLQQCSAKFAVQWHQRCIPILIPSHCTKQSIGTHACSFLQCSAITRCCQLSWAFHWWWPLALHQLLLCNTRTARLHAHSQSVNPC